jgi:hypothetical protein
MGRRRIIALLLILVSMWLFAPTSITRPAAACSTAMPQPGSTPQPATATPLPMPTRITSEVLEAYADNAYAVVIGTIQQVDGARVVVAVEQASRPVPPTLAIITYRESVPSVCDPGVVASREPIVPRTDRGARAVFFLDQQYEGTGSAIVGRNGAILLVEGAQLRDIDSGMPLGPTAQLDQLAIMGPGSVTYTPDQPAASVTAWALAGSGLALLALAGLILKRHSKT